MPLILQASITAAMPPSSRPAQAHLRSGLKRVAPTAGQWIARLTLARPPWMRSLPCHFRNCLDTAARPAARLRMFARARGGGARDDPGACGEIFVCRNDGVDHLENLAKLMLDLLPASITLPGQRFMRRCGKSCLCCGPVIDPRKTEPTLSQARFHETLILAAGLKAHLGCSGLMRPKSKGMHALPVIAELSAFAIDRPTGTQFVSRDFNPNGMVHLSFPHFVLSCGPQAHLSVQLVRQRRS